MLTCLNKCAILCLFKQVREKKEVRAWLSIQMTSRRAGTDRRKRELAAVSHCMTRMRFVLVDEKKANAKEIEKLKSVKGTFTQAGQYQVIIEMMCLLSTMNLLPTQGSKV